VIEARQRQAKRLQAEGILVNAHMDASTLRRYVKLDEQAQQMMAQACERRLLSARGQHRVLRVAQTIADLDCRERVEAEHVSRALGLRPEAGLCGRRAA
jgi:magnesium chelatase family protein